MSNNIEITDIKKTKKGFNALFSHDEFLMSVNDLILRENKLEIGSCLTQQEFSFISRESDNSRAVDKCYTLLSFRMHGKKELYNKLLKYFDADTAQYAVNKMEELGFLDDREFATLKAEYLLNVKKYSVMAVRAKLSSIGIDKGVIDGVLLKFDIDNQIDDIVDIINKKYSQKLCEPQKVIAALLRKGFNYSDISRAMRKIDIDIQEF